MKTFLSFRRLQAYLTAGSTVFLLSAAAVWAGPGGGGVGGGSAGGAASVGSAGGGGGHGGGVSAGGGHGMVSAGQHVGSGLSTGGSFGRSSAPGFSAGAGFSGARLGDSSGGTRLVNPNFNNLARPVFGNGQVSSAPANTAGRGYAPGFARGFGGGSTPSVSGGSRFSNNGPAFRSVTPARVNNAWTDAPATRVSPAARVGRYGYNRAYDPGQSYLGGQAAPGQHLYPGAYNYSAYNHAENNDRRGSRPDRGGYRHRYNRYYDTGLYYPYFYNGFFPAYYGSFDGGYGGYGDYAGIESTGTTGLINNSTNYGQPNFETTPNPYYDQDGTAPASNQAPDNSPLPPNQPSQVGPEGPGITEAHPPKSYGPDSLVEAVQSELSKRGYLATKVDGVYGDPTREALRRFQGDHRISVTGRINEATLHALQLD